MKPGTFVIETPSRPPGTYLTDPKTFWLPWLPAMAEGFCWG
jgi:hypothetical protein